MSVTPTSSVPTIPIPPRIFYSLRALECLARKLGKQPEHLSGLRLLREDLEHFLDDMFVRERETDPVIEYLDGYLDESALRPIIERLKQHHLPPGNRFFMYRHPDGIDLKTGKENLDAYKMVLFLHFISGLERFGEDGFWTN